MVMDMATSAWPEGKIRLKIQKGEQIPQGVVINAQGRDTTEPADLLGPPPGAILPMGQHKGYALGLMVEILSGALSGGGSCRPLDTLYTYENAFFLMAIEVQSIRALSDVAVDVDAMLSYVKSSAPVEAGGEVLVPYERECRLRQQRLREGVPIDQGTWKSLVELANTYGISV